VYYEPDDAPGHVVGMSLILGVLSESLRSMYARPNDTPLRLVVKNATETP